MSPLEQHTAIALALGYTYEDKEITYDGEPIKFRLWRTPSGGGMEKSWPPNYPEDLNAMHEAVKTIPEGLRKTYRRNLTFVVCGFWPEDLRGVNKYSREPFFWGFCNATAAQRAEAFLRTLSLWVGDQPKQKTKQ